MARRRSAPTKRRTTTSRKRTSTKRSGKKFIKSSIKRPGALTQSKKKGESTVAAANRLKKSGTPLQKRQANFFLNVLRPSAAKRRRRKSG